VSLQTILGAKLLHGIAFSRRLNEDICFKLFVNLKFTKPPEFKGFDDYYEFTRSKLVVSEPSSP